MIRLAYGASVSGVRIGTDAGWRRRRARPIGATIRVSVPLRLKNAETAPGVKRGGTVNIVTHTVELECGVDNIPQFIEADAPSMIVPFLWLGVIFNVNATL